jgi:hypothetical protein
MLAGEIVFEAFACGAKQPVPSLVAVVRYACEVLSILHDLAPPLEARSGQIVLVPISALPDVGRWNPLNLDPIVRSLACLNCFLSTGVSAASTPHREYRLGEINPDCPI